MLLTLAVMAQLWSPGTGGSGGSGGGGSSVTDNDIAAVPNDDLLNWGRTEEQIAPINNSFTFSWGGAPIFDQDTGCWVIYGNRSVGGLNTIGRSVSPDGAVFNWSYPVNVFTNNPAQDRWDAGDLTVPFVWVERGEPRPWRMIYCGTASNLVFRCLGLATSTNGIDWERVDAKGTPLTTFIITNVADSDHIDIGNIIHAEGKYWCYWNGTASTNREMHLSYTSDSALTNWIKYGGSTNALFTGMATAAGTWDYEDKDHSAFTTSQNFGWFCPGVYRWDKPDGEIRYVMHVPTYVSSNASGGFNASFACFTSPSPIFTKGNRTFEGWVAYDWFGKSKLFGGQTVSVSGIDVPRLYCEDITQNARMQTRFRNHRMFASVKKADNTWNMEQWVRPAGLELAEDGGTTNGWTFTNLNYLLPKTDPNVHLAIDGSRSNVLAHYKFRETGLRDLSGYRLDLSNAATLGLWKLNDLGLVVSNGIRATFARGTNVVPWNALTNDFTVEVALLKRTTMGAASNRAVFSIGNGTPSNICYVFATGSAGDAAATMSLQMTDASGTSRTFTSAAFNWNDLSHHTFAFHRTAGIVTAFKDGQILSSGAFAHIGTNHTGRAIPLKVGLDPAGINFWDGYIEEIRVASSALWPTNSPAPFPLPIVYTNATGYAFSRVYDYGSSVTGSLNVKAKIPAGCTLTVKGRAASGRYDKSLTLTDFSTGDVTGRYQQFLITMTGSGNDSPTIISVDPKSK